MDIWVRNNEVLRLTPRQNDAVNSYWMCDHGRVDTFKFVNSESRVDGPHVNIDGKLKKVAWEEAFKKVTGKLKSFAKNEIAFIGSAYATVEDNYMLTKFASSFAGSKNIDFIRHIDPSFGDDILRQEDITPNSKGAEAVGVKPGKDGLDLAGIFKAVKEGKIKALYVMEEDIAAYDAELENALSKLELLVVHASNFNKTTEFAHVVFPAATYAEKNGTYVNFDGMVQRLRPAVTTVDTDRALDGMSQSRLDKFGTQYDRWAQGHKYDAKSSWKILAGLSASAGVKMKFNMAEEVFDEIAKTNKYFAGMDYDVIGEQGTQSKLNIAEKTVTA